jgi:DNA-binding MarR family transcriptional regulator
MPEVNDFATTLRAWAEVFMRRSMRDLREVTRQTGLSMSQISTLFRIYRGGVCGVSDIGEDLGVTSAAASQMVERMVRLGLLERSENLKDRRNKPRKLTAQGQAAVCEMIDARQRWLEDLTAALTPEQQQGIVAALTVLTQAAKDLDQPEK